MSKLETAIKSLGRELGFDVIGITSADPFIADESAALERVRSGFMDGLPWYTEDRVRAANRPRSLLENGKSVISLAMSYLSPDEDNPDSYARGKVARYARGEDYHEVIKKRLRAFVLKLPEIVGRDVETRSFVDDGPMNDRAAARRAGVGWFGKNTNIITRSHGSWVFLAQVITDIDLEPDTPLRKTCGNCVRCIEDCPTGAIVAPYVIDNDRCISFMTIELRGVIPREMRPLMGDWIFGCDICQDVCPANRKAMTRSDSVFGKLHDFTVPELLKLLRLNDETFAKQFRGTPIKRAKRVGLQRNVCVALGNIGDLDAAPQLVEVLFSSEPIVRTHAAWALGRIGGPLALTALRRRHLCESDPSVCEEITVALQHLELSRMAGE